MYALNSEVNTTSNNVKVSYKVSSKLDTNNPSTSHLTRAKARVAAKTFNAKLLEQGVACVKMAPATEKDSDSLWSNQIKFKKGLLSLSK